MKALSVSSFFAMQIMLGNKTIEWRTWCTAHRGELLICSNRERTPGTIPSHALCVVRITDVQPFVETKANLDAACLQRGDVEGGYAWKLEFVSIVKPFQVRGKPGLFDVLDNDIIKIDEETMTGEETSAFIAQYINPLLVV